MFDNRYKGLTPYLLFCVACYLNGAILFGLDTGSFGAVQALPSWLNEFGEPNAQDKMVLPKIRASLMNSIPWIGKLSGCFMAEITIERLGFRKTAFVANIIQFVGVILELTAKEWVQFTIGRMVTYYAVGLCENLVPSYNAEIAPAKHRGLLAGSIMTFTGLGNLWGAGMGQAFANETRRLGWIITVSMQLIPAFMMITLVPFTPESPRWLISKGRAEEAERNLERLRRPEETADGTVQREIELLSELSLESSQKRDVRWSDLIRGNNLRRIWIVVTLFVISQMNGNQFVQSYGPTFYIQQGLGSKSFLYALLGQVVGFVGCFIGLVLLDITGRRPCFIYGSGVVTFLLFLAAGLGLDSTQNTHKANTIVACFILIKAFSRISATNCAFLTGAEIGGAVMRRKIMALGTSSDVIAAFLVTFVTPYLLPVLGVGIGWIFGGVAGFGVIWGYFFFPELKGRSLEEVDEMFEEKLWAFRFSSYKTKGKAAELNVVENGGYVGKTDQAEHLEKVDSRDVVSGRRPSV